MFEIHAGEKCDIVKISIGILLVLHAQWSLSVYLFYA